LPGSKQSVFVKFCTDEICAMSL